MVGLAQLPSKQSRRSQRLPLSHKAPLHLSKKLIPNHRPNPGLRAPQSVTRASTPPPATSPSHPNSDICWVACSNATKIPQLAAWGNFPAHSAGRKKARRTKCAASLFACPRTRWEVTPCGQRTTMYPWTRTCPRNHAQTAQPEQRRQTERCQERAGRTSSCCQPCS